MLKLLRVLRTATGMMVVCCLPVVADSTEPSPGAPPWRDIPGVTSPDQFPRGCVDCHVNRTDLQMDVRISTAMRRWEDGVDPQFLARIRPFVPAGMKLAGKHPAMVTPSAAIPGSCLGCHSQASQSAPPFGRLLHGLHFAGGEQNHFLSMFQGECTHCHKLDAVTATWSLGSGTEQQ
jgi:hypothetical protein